VEVLDQTRQLLFPGFSGQKRLARQTIGFHVGNLIARLGADLTEQINHCLCTELDSQRPADASPCLDRLRRWPLDSWRASRR